MAWDDTQTSTSSIEYTEWNNMVTYIKSAIDVSDSINVSSATISALTTSTLTIGSLSVSTISTDTSLGTSNTTLSTQGAIKAYVDANSSSGSGAGNTILTFSIDGELSTGTKTFYIVPDELNGLVVKEVRLACLSLPTGANVQVDVTKNGTATTNSIYTSDTPQDMSTSETATNGLYQTACDSTGARVGTPGTTLDSAQNGVVSDDVLYVIVRQVGSTLTGSDMRIQITFGAA